MAVRARPKLGDWTCDNCGHSWKPGPNLTLESSGSGKIRLFLSYGRRDAEELANRLGTDLNARGYDIWRDTHRICAGADWQIEIEDGLRSTALVVALMSPHSVRRRHAKTNDPAELDSVCLDEISYARFATPPKPIVPVMAKQCDPPLCIYRLDYVDLRAWQTSEKQYQRGLVRLLQAIEAALRGEVRYRSWEDDLRPWDFSPLMNLKLRNFVGREWLLDEIDAWRASCDERALLIKGDPGVGKSAFVARLVQLNPDGQVLAYHFCQSETPETLRPARFIRNLAAMVASQLEAYAACLDEPAVSVALLEVEHWRRAS